MEWQRTPSWLRLLGKPKWRVKGFGGFWLYASKRLGTIDQYVRKPPPQTYSGPNAQRR